MDEVFSGEWKSFFDAAKRSNELEVPEDYFTQSASVLMLNASKNVLPDVEIPDGYFDFSEAEILSKIEVKGEDSGFFETRNARIISAIRLESMRGEHDLNVPDDYFNRAQENILGKLNSKGRIVPLRSKALWFSVAAAAAIAFVVFVIVPGNKRKQELSFATLLEQSDIDVDDVEYFASEDEVYDLFLAFEESSLQDTLVPDSAALPDLLPPSEKPNAKDAGNNVPLDPRTGLPVKISPGQVKPSANQTIPSWDDISNEDLLEYLLEESDEDVLNDL